MSAKDSPTYNSTEIAIKIATIAKDIGFFSLGYDKFENEPETIGPLPYKALKNCLCKLFSLNSFRLPRDKSQYYLRDYVRNK